MVLTKTELLAWVQDEVRILLHLVGKVDPTALDYRPTPGQRSIGELVRYLSMMGPTILRYGLADPPDIAIWTTAEEAAAARDFDANVAAIAGQADEYNALLSTASDATLRSEITDFDGQVKSRGAFIVQWVLCGGAAYRAQLFLYLKASGQYQLNSGNLWSGVDVVTA